MVDFENVFSVDDIVVLKQCVRRRLSLFERLRDKRELDPFEYVDVSDDIVELDDLLSRLDWLMGEML